MRLTGTFSLNIEAASGPLPARISVVLAGAVPDENGVVHLTPDCATLDELENWIHTLQDELETLRADARRAFMVSAGHA
jgi:hypothetical protein